MTRRGSAGPRGRQRRRRNSGRRPMSSTESSAAAFSTSSPGWTKPLSPNILRRRRANAPRRSWRTAPRYIRPGAPIRRPTTFSTGFRGGKPRRRPGTSRGGGACWSRRSGCPASGRRSPWRCPIERKDGGAVRLARADGKWTLEGAQGKTPKDSAIATLLDDLRDLRSADIAAEPAKDLAAWGLDHPDLRIALTDKEGQPIGSVLGAKHDGKPYVMRAGSETVFEGRDYMYARLDKQPKNLVEEPGAAAATTTTEPSGGAGTAASPLAPSDNPPSIRPNARCDPLIRPVLSC